jgi:16S rRNA (uracil1498-N3)-methyltransferase
LHYFHVPQPATLLLPEEESLHAVKVLRLQPGDEVMLLDGRGGVYRAEITLPHPKRCGFSILSEEHRSTGRSYRLHVAIAPTKNIERLEWFIEKAVEIGVDEITPLLCQFSERKQVKDDRLEKILLSACKQSIQAVFPVLNPLTNFKELVDTATAECKTIAHCYPHDKKDFRAVCSGYSDILVLIGPEGDFSPEEVEMAMAHDFIPVSLGESRLRTETAGIMACAISSCMH